MRSNILIQSNSDDTSTDDVLSWLYYLNDKFIINKLLDSYIIMNFKLSLSNESLLKFKINNIHIDNNTSFWYRRGEMSFMKSNFVDFFNLQRELQIETINPIVAFLNGKYTFAQINKFRDNHNGKLETLFEAALAGLLIPEVLITDNSDELKDFVFTHKKVITKSIRNPIKNTQSGQYEISFLSQMKLLTPEIIGNEHFKFMPSFFQKYIDKKFEIRTFYIDGQFKSMAIFSQQNEKTKFDFRNYDLKRPNRCIPYQLPKEIEKKLETLMKNINMNCGSFDIIYSSDEKYVFLEVNPIGQFQWLSRNCNYFIERLLANKIIYGI